MEFPRMTTDILKRLRMDRLGKRVKKFLLLTSVVFVAVLFTRGDYGLFRIYKLHSKVDEAKKDITHLKVQAEDLTWEIDKLKNDSAYIKLYASEQYGYAKSNQKIIQFLPSPEDSTK
ncbi:MAG: septum formation initiator family protein [candidate division Zixibacteria bacterium]|nr:septum formation initiator family protein [candidate division Zixibacteria bacterium]